MNTLICDTRVDARHAGLQVHEGKSYFIMYFIIMIDIIVIFYVFLISLGGSGASG